MHCPLFFYSPIYNNLVMTRSVLKVNCSIMVSGLFFFLSFLYDFFSLVSCFSLISCVPMHQVGYWNWKCASDIHLKFCDDLIGTRSISDRNLLILFGDLGLDPWQIQLSTNLSCLHYAYRPQPKHAVRHFTKWLKTKSFSETINSGS